MNESKIIPVLSSFILFFSLFIFSQSNLAQNDNNQSKRDKSISAAREIMSSTSFCGLVTMGDHCQPHIRTMEPFAPDENMVIWFGTNSNSRKVEDINNNSEVAIFYNDPTGNGYVVYYGIAKLINSPEEKSKYWKDEWKQYYPDKEKDASYILIKVLPKQIDVINYKQGIYGDSESWRAETVNF